MPKEVPKLCSSCRRKVFKNTACEKTYCPNRKGKFKNKITKSHPWYNLSIWKGNPNKPLGQRGGLREAQLIKQPLCEDCLNQGVGTEATVVDHIKEFKKGNTEHEQWLLFIDTDNHRSLCSSHHNAKTARERVR